VRRAPSLAEEALGRYDGKRPPIAVIAQYYFLARVQTCAGLDRQLAARLWREQGKVQQASELLSPVYGWFTEAFFTRDLMEAKALLEELAA
jgi:hypothetical protein